MNKHSTILTLAFCLFLVACEKPDFVVTHVESYGYIIEDGMPYLTLSKPLDKIEFHELTINELLSDGYFDDVSEANWIKERIKEENYEAVLVRGPKTQEYVRLVINRGKLVVDSDYERPKPEFKMRLIPKEELSPAKRIFIELDEDEGQKTETE